MRGTHDYFAADLVPVGIIPAYAGNTEDSAEVGDFPRDHPRVCGEHLSAECFLPGSQGSSPRMRGTLFEPEPLLPIPGIIPAYAGNTVVNRMRDNASRDHPRVCGEHRL